jgi:glycosyltransferase involved in cell wall biosynthesis
LDIVNVCFERKIWSVMKVIILGTRGFPNVQGGVEIHCQNLAVNLVKLGCEVVVFTRKPYIDPNIKEFKGVKLKSLFAFKMKTLETFCHTMIGVVVAFFYRPDILHIQGIGPALFAPLARFLGMKVVVTSHGSNYHHLKWGSFGKFVLRVGELFAVCFANRLIAISKFIYDEIKSKYGRESINIQNGICVKKRTHQTMFLDKRGIVPNKYILSVGRLVPEKGFHILIQAFKALAIEDWKLVIAGAADHEDEYSRDLMASTQDNSAIVMTGYLTQDRLRQLYSHAGLFILPSFYEGLPIVLLEAMSYGLPCIVSDIAGNRTVELDEDRYFKPGDTKELYHKIKRYIHQPLTDREVLDQIHYISDSYDWRHVAIRTIEIYESIYK